MPFVLHCSSNFAKSFPFILSNAFEWNETLCVTCQKQFENILKIWCVCVCQRFRFHAELLEQHNGQVNLVNYINDKNNVRIYLVYTGPKRMPSYIADFSMESD